MGYLGRRIGKSQDQGNSNPTGSDAGGGLLDLFAAGYFNRQGTLSPVAPLPAGGLTATGGVISDYTDPGPGNIYRAHIFTSTGTFDVTETPGGYGDTVDVLVVAGGGGGGPSPVSGTVAGGGGGGGGLVYKPGHSVSVAPYTITVGGGGAPNALVGGFSAFGDDAASPFPATSLIAIGGGVGARGPNVTSGNEGGSGGGGDDGVAGSPGIQGTSPNPRSIPADSVTYGFGNAGGTGNGTAPGYNGGGGGGAGGAGGAATAGTTGAGGVGKQYLISGPPATTQSTGTPGPNPGGGYFAGGGSGGYRYAPIAVGTAGAGGGGAGNGAGNKASDGTYSTGGGGGGSGDSGIGGSGGSGIVVVRYQIGSVQTSDAKASGGSVSFYNSKTIHTFTSTGTFETPGTFSETCEYVVVGGGGGAFTGGGGAGGYRTGTTPIGPSVSYTITIGAGSNAKSPIGSPSSIGTIPIAIPGGGTSLSGPDGDAQPGASGGGGTQGGSGSTGASGTGSPYPGTVGPTPASGWGHAGGNGTPADKSGGGGGGAGSAGDPGSQGGTGVQLPTTFRDPNGFQYDNHPDHPFRPSATAGYFVAGGGAGTVYTPFPQASPPLGPTPYSATYPGMGGVGGGGCRNPADPRYSVYGFNGMANTGGGGAGGVPATPVGGAQGGSGLVLIAYPT